VLDADAIVFADNTYRLALAERDTVDTERFARAATAAFAAAREQRRSALTHAAAQWNGTPLPEERYSPWSAHWREHLEGTYHRVLAELAATHRGTGDELGVADACRRLLALDALDEGAHRTLMEAYARTGRPALALRQFPGLSPRAGRRPRR
jgi:DNA-binding SARP family transcriptional activator